VFNNTLASVAPFLATSDTLFVVVPTNANNGPLYVSSKGVKSNSVNVDILRGIGDVWVMGGGADYHIEVPVASGSEKYLVVPHSATSSGAPYAYRVTPDNTTASAPAQHSGAARSAGTTDFALEFESSIHAKTIEYLRTRAKYRDGFVARSAAGATQTSRDFLVLKCVDCSLFEPGSFATITATLRYEGTHAAIYSDDVQPTGSFTQADYDAFGAMFDNQIYATNTNFFGPPSDIDNNGKIVILFSPRVNDLTADGTATSGFISGFVLLNDLAPEVNWPTNGMEIFYSMVPDPNGEYGNVFTHEMVNGVVPGTLAHEFEHMISNGYRWVVLGFGQSIQTRVTLLQQKWLEEGMAHMAEDLNNMDDQNIRRANRYLASPATTSLLGNAELRPYNLDTLEQRGCVYLFLRYLGDLYGEEIFKTIVQSRDVGVWSIENVTRTDFHVSTSEFLATLYLSDRGITDDEKYNFSSFDFQSVFGDLRVSNQTASAGYFEGSVRSATGDHHLVSGVRSPALRLGVSSPTTGDVRVIVVRTE
jgi:hypothetical protein